MKGPTRFPKPMPPSRATALIALLLLYPVAASAAFEIEWPDARSAAMLTGGLDLTAPSLLSVGAGAPESEARVRRATLSAGELFGLAEARGWCARVTAPVRAVTVAFDVSNLGGALYHERGAGLSATWLVASDTEVEIGARCLEVGARGESGRWAAVLDAAATRRVLGRVFLGARCSNLTGSEIGGSPLASTSTFGLALKLPGIALQARALMQEGLETTSSLGFEAALSRWLRIRAGASSSPGRVGAGLGIGCTERCGERTGLLSRPTLDLAWQWHPKLGGSSFVSVEVCF